jgi:uncharacterized membrane protein
MFAVLIYIATLVAAQDTPINYGIIFCMAASTLIYALLQHFHIEPKGYCAGVLLLAAFVLCLNVPEGSVGLGNVAITLPKQIYQTEYFSWLGLPGPTFTSGDYYPLLPYTLMFLAGSVFFTQWSTHGFPQRIYQPFQRGIEFVGRHSLAFYVVHQPVMLVVLTLTLGS